MATSRIGRKPITIPKGVEVKIDGKVISVKGPKGSLRMPLERNVKIQHDGKDTLNIETCNEGYSRKGSGSKLKRSITGTTRAKLSNMVEGVAKGFERKLTLVGVGYRAIVKGSTLHLTVGRSHPVTIDAPEGITFEAPSLTEIIVKGMDKHLVGHTAAIVRSKRPPEPYKGKGIRYSDEIVVRKETKKK